MALSRSTRACTPRNQITDSLPVGDREITAPGPADPGPIYPAIPVARSSCTVLAELRPHAIPELRQSWLSAREPISRPIALLPAQARSSQRDPWRTFASAGKTRIRRESACRIPCGRCGSSGVAHSTSSGSVRNITLTDTRRESVSSNLKPDVTVRGGHDLGTLP